MGISQPGDFYGITSGDITVGAQEGGVAFLGLYLSDEKPEEVGGVEFLAELALDLGIGVAAEWFWSLNGSRGLVIFVTTGEEIEASVGVGYTTTVKL